jgi:hypothetical protein
MAFAMELRNQPNCTIITPGPRHWDIFSRLCAATNVKGSLVPDAFFAALTIESGSEVAPPRTITSPLSVIPTLLPTLQQSDAFVKLLYRGLIDPAAGARDQFRVQAPMIDPALSCHAAYQQSMEIA